MKMIQKLAVLAAAPLALATSAYAAVPEGVKTSLETAQTDAVEVAGIVFGAIVAIFAFKLMRRAL